MRIHPSYPTTLAAVCLLAVLTIGSTRCGPREAPPAPGAATPSPAPAATKSEPGGPAVPSPAAPPQVATPPALQPATKPASAVNPSPVAPVATATPSTSAQAPTPAAEAKPAPTAQVPKPPAPAQAASPISDPGGEVAVKPGKAGLSRVGVAACKMCHKVQFASWSETAHGKRTPPLDCESCHGPGSEYKPIAVMKDAAKAKAAGLVQPTAAFCATCHKRGWNDGMLKKAHAHKP